MVMNIPHPTGTVDIAVEPKDQVVYVGDITPERGHVEMVALADQLTGDTKVVLVGRVSAADGLIQSDSVEMTGRLPHDQAWQLASGSVAGLCLLRPLPAYQQAVATKIWEYMAWGIPPVVSDLPGQRRIVESIDPDLVCGDVPEAVSVIERLKADDQYRNAIAEKAVDCYRKMWELNRPDLTIQSVVAP